MFDIYQMFGKVPKTSRPTIDSSRHGSPYDRRSTQHTLLKQKQRINLASSIHIVKAMPFLVQKSHRCLKPESTGIISALPPVWNVSRLCAPSPHLFH